MSTGSIFKKSLRIFATYLSLVISHFAYGSEEIQIWHLDDGTEVLFLEDHRAPLVSIEINFPVNTLMPWVIQNDGEAAFECQMLDPARRIERKREKLGITLSASMGWRNARIGGSSLTSEFQDLVDLIRESLNNREYSKAEVKKWHRGRILNWHTSSTDPRTALRKTSMDLLYTHKDDPRKGLYAKPKGISTNSRKLANVRDVILSVPGRNIAVSGDMSRQEVNELVRDLLPDIDQTKVFSDTLLKPESFEASPVITIELKDLTQVYLALIRSSLTLSSSDFPAYTIVNQILGGTFSSRLYQRLRHDSGDSYSATLNRIYTTMFRSGLFSLDTYTHVENSKVAEEKLRSVLVEIHKNGVTKNEVDKALAYLNGSRIFYRQTPSQIVNLWAANRMQKLPGNFQQLTLDQAAKLSLGQINEFIRDFYNPGKFAMVRVVPKSG